MIHRSRSDSVRADIFDTEIINRHAASLDCHTVLFDIELNRVKTFTRIFIAVEIQNAGIPVIVIKMQICIEIVIILIWLSRRVVEG